MMEMTHPHVLGFLSGALSTQEAAEKLQVPRSTLWRLQRRLNVRGPLALVHGLKGRRSNNAKPDALRRKVCELFARDYQPAGISVGTFYEYGVRGRLGPVCYTTVLRWLREAGLA
ncbi:MAG TPA: helix-turn-helix domain-containing protein [bacterium]|nr:helix-turn-helix domain-containing protein [bacterium]